MVADTGFTNGTPREPNDSGGLGAGVPAKKSDIRMAVRALTRGWLDEAKAAKVVRWLMEVGNTTNDDRAKVSAADGLIKIVALAHQMEVDEEKSRRLDAGEATENVRVFDIKIPEAEALNRGVG